MWSKRINLMMGDNLLTKDETIVSFCLEMSLALMRGAGKMSYLLQKDAQGADQFRTTLCGSEIGTELETIRADLFRPWVNLVTSCLREVREHNGVIEGIFETRDPNSMWNVRYDVNAQQMDFERRYDPTPPVTLAERISDLQNSVVGFGLRFCRWLRSPKKRKFGRAVVRTGDSEELVLRLLVVIVIQAVAEDTDRMKFQFTTEASGNKVWEIRGFGPKGERNYPPGPAGLFKSSVEFLFSEVLEQVTERDGVSEGILQTCKPDSKWHVRHAAAAQEVLFGRVRDIQPASK